MCLRDKTKSSALHYDPSLEIYERLLSQPGVNVNLRNIHGTAPLHKACNSRDAEVKLGAKVK